MPTLPGGPYDNQDVADVWYPEPPNDPETTAGRLRFRVATWRPQPKAPSPPLKAVKPNLKPDPVRDTNYYKLGNVSDTKLPGLDDSK